MLWAFKGGEPWPWRPEALPAGGKPSQSWKARAGLEKLFCLIRESDLNKLFCTYYYYCCYYYQIAQLAHVVTSQQAACEDNFWGFLGPKKVYSRPKTKLNSLVVAPCCGGKNTIWDGSSTVDIPTDAPGCTVQPLPVLSKHLPERTHVPRLDLLLFVIPTRLTELLIPCGHPGHPAGIL